MRGSCLCGGVVFEADEVVGPFELCHCSRCRKATGSAYAALVGVQTKSYRMVQGAELVRSYQAPLIEQPPAYRVFFCSSCGSPVPDPAPVGDWFELPAGLLDDDIEVRPDKHIYVDLKAPWEELAAMLPQYTKAEIRAQRKAARRHD